MNKEITIKAFPFEIAGFLRNLNNRKIYFIRIKICDEWQKAQ
jgi:hypothetical protein